MQFINKPVKVGTSELSKLLLNELTDKKTVLWLLSGGSNIDLEVQIMKNLLGHEANLLITLMDERFVEVGDANSNWQQLVAAGIDFGSSQVYPVLQEKLDLAATTSTFETTLGDCLQKADMVVGQFGMGADGHTAGILPDTVATRANGDLAMGYHTDVYDRVTMTFEALQMIDVAYCFAYGADKHKSLLQLQEEEIALTVQPVQILKQINMAYVYNDQIGDQA